MDHGVSFRVHHMPFAYQHINCIPQRRSFIYRCLFALVLSFTLCPVVMQNSEALFLILDQLVADISPDFFMVYAEQPAIEFLQGNAEHLLNAAL
ncbi:Uncharacterised protein [Klebsiella pneumoniae]|nr:Uncharacterised protein [Klebsiella pneumoniae]